MSKAYQNAMLVGELQRSFLFWCLFMQDEEKQYDKKIDFKIQKEKMKRNYFIKRAQKIVNDQFCDMYNYHLMNEIIIQR